MKVCEECKGTGWVTLFTTSGPCKTCAGVPEASLHYDRDKGVIRDHTGWEWEVKKKRTVVCDGGEQKPKGLEYWCNRG